MGVLLEKKHFGVGKFKTRRQMRTWKSNRDEAQRAFRTAKAKKKRLNAIYRTNICDFLH